MTKREILSFITALLVIFVITTLLQYYFGFHEYNIFSGKYYYKSIPYNEFTTLGWILQIAWWMAIPLLSYRITKGN